MPGTLRRLMRHRPAMVGLTVFGLVVAAAIVGPYAAPYDPTAQSFVHQLQPPSAEHLFGTDEFGRDIFSRVLYGTRLAIEVGIIADGIALAVGVFIGLLAGYFGGWWDTILMRTVDVMLAFPYLLLAMMVIAALGPGLDKAMIAIGIVYVPQYARIVRGSVLSVKNLEYVQSSRAAGSPSALTLLKHVLPNVTAPIIVQATLMFGTAIVETAGLGFLGLGAQPPTPEWGAMLSTGRTYMLTAPWIATFPGLCILVTVVGLNLLGDGLRDVLDPKLRK